MTANGSVIHDIGYKPYTGPRLERGHIVRALYFYSLRAAFGFGRSPKARIIPVLMFVGNAIPAAISIYKVASFGGDPLIAYDRYAYTMVLLLIVFIATAAPELVSRDLRHHILPLYFARPLRRADYPLAKMLALATAVVLFEAIPLLVMYLGVIASATSGSAVWTQTKALVPGLLVALVYGLVLAPLSLLISSLTGRRAVVTGAIAILFLATSAISGVLESVGTQRTFTQAGQPVGPDGPAINPATGDPVGKIVESDGYQPIARDGGLIDPLRLIEGTRIWALHATDGKIPDPQSLGAVYALELAVLTSLTTGGLLLRYRKLGVA